MIRPLHPGRVARRPPAPTPLGNDRALSELARLAAFLVDCLLPPLCLHCGAPLAAARPGLCPRCRGAIAALPEGCLRCGLPRPGSPESCARCREWPAGLAAVAATRYGGPARTAVRGLKYAGWRHLTDLCAEPMVDALARAVARGAAPAALVPVPLHPARRRARGFNQARVLADALARRTALPVVDVLVRVRPTAPQPGLGRAARAANLAGAFRADGAVGPRLALVDDVATSGATLAAAGGALLAAGALEVTGVSFALALDPALR